jgi:hypothetical protein
MSIKHHETRSERVDFLTDYFCACGYAYWNAVALANRHA